MNQYKQVCKHCGSEDILVMRWVNPNTNEASSMRWGTEGLVDWCNNCSNECVIVEKRDYLINYILEEQENVEWEPLHHLDFPFRKEDFIGMSEDHIEAFKNDLDEILKKQEEEI